MAGAKEGRIAIVLTPSGVQTISFLNSDKNQSLSFYKSIEPLIKDFEGQIKDKANGAGKCLNQG